MKVFKRLTAAVLTGALALSLALVPASAAPGSFTDVSDPNTAVNADILRLMGVVNGTGGNMFNPGDPLTRAQFCTMVVTFLQRGEEAPRYATRTIFTDVKSGHWARSYVNLAASISIAEGDGESSASIPLISGVGDGRFLPDDNISMAQACTILLRALGYTSKEAGAVWPQGYMNLAESTGLSEGVDLKAGDAISRAQAAQLFVNALRCKTAKGEVYYKSLGKVANETDKTIILAVNVETDDGSGQGAIRTTSNENSEAFLPAHGDANVSALQGKRGHLILNDKEEVVCFVPDGATPVTITLNGDAQPSFVRASGGRQYTISSNTRVFTSGSGQSKDYLSAYETLTSGSQITMYAENGKIVAIYSTAGSTTIDSDAVVVMGNATAATFHHLTGGVTNFNIVKDRQAIRLNQIKPYDVATYDSVTNTLVVSDLRLTAIYTDPKPTPKTPKTLSVLGTEFEVLESAWDTIGDLKPGDGVALLLTADGKVGGIVPASGQVRSTAIGTATKSGATIYLPNGQTKQLSATVSNPPASSGEPVIISAGRNDLSVSLLPTLHAPGDFKVADLKLGELTVATTVRVYERVKGGAMQAVDRGSLAMDAIPAAKISTYHTNSAGLVDYIVLEDVTGVAYLYGMMVGGYEEINGQERYVWYLRSGSQEVRFSPTTTYRGQSGDMVGVVLGSNREGNATIREVIRLQEVNEVKASDFFDSQGEPYIRVGAHTYRVANGVECYYNRSGNPVAKENWLASGTGTDRFNSIKTYSDTFSIYVDPVGQQVRVIVAR